MLLLCLLLLLLLLLCLLLRVLVLQELLEMGMIIVSDTGSIDYSRVHVYSGSLNNGRVHGQVVLNEVEFTAFKHGDGVPETRGRRQGSRRDQGCRDHCVMNNAL